MEAHRVRVANQVPVAATEWVDDEVVRAVEGRRVVMVVAVEGWSAAVERGRARVMVAVRRVAVLMAAVRVVGWAVVTVAMVAQTEEHHSWAAGHSLLSQCRKRNGR